MSGIAGRISKKPQATVLSSRASTNHINAYKSTCTNVCNRQTSRHTNEYVCVHIWFSRCGRGAHLVSRSGCRVFLKLQINLICLTRPLNRALRTRHTAAADTFAMVGAHAHWRALACTPRAPHQRTRTRTQMGTLSSELRHGTVFVRLCVCVCNITNCTRARAHSSTLVCLLGSADNKFLD